MVGLKCCACMAGEENGARCATQAGARAVALITQRAAQPYDFMYDHVSGEAGTQDDMFMRESSASSLLQLYWP